MIDSHRARAVAALACVVVVALALPTPAFANDAAQKVAGMANALREVKHTDETRIKNVAKEMAAAGEAANDALVDLMSDPEPSVRRAAIQALGTRVPANLLPAFVQALSDDVPHVAADAVRAVSDYPGDWASSALVRYLGHKNEMVRAAVIEALAKRPDKQVREVILKQYDNPPAGVGAGPFLAALGRFPDGRTERLLLKSLEDPALLEYALTGLELYGPKAGGGLANWIVKNGKSQSGAAMAAVGVLASYGDAGMKPMTKVVEKAPLAVKKAALATLIERSGETAGKLVTKLASHRNPDVRKAALEAMPKTKGADPSKSLEKNLKDRDPKVRELAAAAIPEGKRDPAVQRILIDRYRLLSRERTPDNLPERAAVLKALGRVGDSAAVNELIQAMGRPDEEAAAIAGLSEMGAAAVPPLLFVMKTGDSKRVPVAIRALSEVGDAAVEPMVELLKHPSRDARTIARKTLARLGNTEIVPKVIALIDDDKTPGREALVALLGHLYSPESYQALKNYATNAYDHNMRLAAVRALVRQTDPRVLELLMQIAEKDDSNTVRELAVATLIGRGAKEALPLLKKMLSYEKDFIRETAAFGIGYMGSQDDVPAVAKNISSPRISVVSAVRNGLRRLTFRTDLKHEEQFVNWLKARKAKPVKLASLEVQTIKLSSGGTLRYALGGTGRPLLILPGGPDLAHDYLRPGLDPLASSHRLLYVDLPGRGGSKLPEGQGPSLDRDVDAAASLLGRLNLRDVDVYGHGFGAFVAVALAKKHPKLVRRLVLDHPPMPTLSGWVAELDAMASNAPQPWKGDLDVFTRNAAQYQPEVRDSFLAVALMTGAVGKVQAMVEVRPHLQTKPKLRSALLASMGDFDLRDSFRTITKPTIVVFGDAYPAPDASKAWRKQFTDANPAVRLEVLTGLGYLAQLEDRKKWAAAVGAFIK